ncbi:MAG: DegT/DnrJ/EryC1/StrS family aminotransferase [Alphaproteobacteria bacterium]|nr:DegT/DnrJ/EryC1/StrS family aminotransferase [Alphaproteobacteria bacterium]
MIPFIDLATQQRKLRPHIDKAISKVLDSGQYILGEEVSLLEQKLSDFTGAPYVIGCSSGTDALLLILMAIDAGPGDAVFVPAFTFVATAEAPAFLGATPFFVDVLPNSYNLNPDDFARAIVEAKAQGLNPKAVIPVDLFGMPADYPAIQKIAQQHDIFVLSDCAQSFGATLDNNPMGAWGNAAATSFFPAKPLGCYGDGGAVFCHDEATYQTIMSLRVHGQKGRYFYEKIGMTGRLDSIQAAILLEKMTIFEAERIMRQKVAMRYHQALQDKLTVQIVPDNIQHIWAQYCLLAENTTMRDNIQKHCAAHDIPTVIYYPTPLSTQGVFAQYPVIDSGLPVTENLCERIFAIPMHPYLDEATQDKIISAILAAC